MFGVDFMAAEGSLDMAAAHKHRKRVREWESGGWKGKVTTLPSTAAALATETYGSTHNSFPGLLREAPPTV